MPDTKAKNATKHGRAGTVLPSDAGNAIPRLMATESYQSGGQEAI